MYKPILVKALFSRCYPRAKGDGRVTKQPIKSSKQPIYISRTLGQKVMAALPSCSLCPPPPTPPPVATRLP